MNKKIDSLIDKIFHKLSEHKSKELAMEKEEFKKFILFLLNNN